jgi:hypothetical protein
LFHRKGGVAADLPARARIISDEAERRDILAHSPLIEVTQEGMPR